ncbi:Lar family restriction alleviation protein [Stenotrophomonas maltophilia]|uniref:Lar family restriction alleviation protein n=1 Tax=Stenotrophomonas maltophilia TaxID=40324 RepID=UPI001AAFEE96|nr:Lar family restriction alleviation protein [Stenotrophomonas maltophilia]MBO3002273.1 Lar family restriction alleviation protein [Stenotrophomonas maltophilia]MBP1381583.1 Lar family restriction alleviation protein [Stenotrophomonas maltophilia]MBP1386595.1 Lar family restriction alleviation protein [Stenotrophomonas maltophilia]
MSTDKTLADVQPGGRVRLGDQAELDRHEFQAWTRELLPCPFCGNVAEFVPYKDNGLTLKCKSMGCIQRNQRTLRYGIDWLRTSMAEHWNTRALSAQPSPGKQAAHCPVKHCGMTYARVPADGRCHACGATVQPSPGGQDALATLIDQWMARADRHEASALEADSIGGMQMAVAVHEARAAELNAAVHSLKEALAARQPVGEPGEMSPEFIDTARAAIAWVLWHHQGGSSPVGQPLRFALGMGQHDRMTDHQIAEAKRFAAWANATTEDFHHRAPAQAVDLGQFRTKVAELLRSEFDLEVADPEDHRHDDGSGEADRIAGKIIALLDSRAVGNG